mmetsp:Transcript_25986/g.61126  ORF Transcript_25986/g.61126 Transcript_25986/m.61126 type:complete len:202 (+) Transcript_25986:85-690(+)
MQQQLIVYIHFPGIAIVKAVVLMSSMLVWSKHVQIVGVNNFEEERSCCPLHQALVLLQRVNHQFILVLVIEPMVLHRPFIVIRAVVDQSFHRVYIIHRFRKIIFPTFWMSRDTCPPQEMTGYVEIFTMRLPLLQFLSHSLHPCHQNRVIFIMCSAIHHDYLRESLFFKYSMADIRQEVITTKNKPRLLSTGIIHDVFPFRF